MEIYREDNSMFKKVRKFADKYGLIFVERGQLPTKKTPEEMEQYCIIYEWTDGDQITFFVMKQKELCYNNDTCRASVDDWEENRDDLIVIRLKRACIKYGIIPPEDEC